MDTLQKYREAICEHNGFVTIMDTNLDELAMLEAPEMIAPEIEEALSTGRWRSLLKFSRKLRPPTLKSPVRLTW